MSCMSNAKNKKHYEAEITIIGITKHEVDTMDFSGIEASFSAMSENKMLRTKYKSACSFCFHGYDDDPREILEIPEVMRWLNESIHLNIPWFYFLKPTVDSGLNILLCAYVTPISLTETVNSTRAKVDLDSVEDFIRVVFHNINTFTEKYGISMETNRELCERLAKFYAMSLRL